MDNHADSVVIPSDDEDEFGNQPLRRRLFRMSHPTKMVPTKVGCAEAVDGSPEDFQRLIEDSIMVEGRQAFKWLPVKGTYMCIVPLLEMLSDEEFTWTMTDSRIRWPGPPPCGLSIEDELLKEMYYKTVAYCTKAENKINGKREVSPLILRFGQFWEHEALALFPAESRFIHRLLFDCNCPLHWLKTYKVIKC